MNIVIVGAGVAGITAAETARQQAPNAQITIFGQEREPTYFRPRLPEIVSGQVAVEKIYLHPDNWYREKNLEVRSGERVVEICAENSQIRGSLGSRLKYDRLLLATGAESTRPELAGSKIPGVFTVRSLTDAWGLHYEAKRAKAAVLMGAGLLGLEIGYALTRLGVTVHVLERSGRILPRQTTPESSAKLNRLLTDLGFQFHLNSQASQAEGYSRLENVVLASGDSIAADILVIAAGITPSLELARELNLKLDRAVVVDDYLETSTPGIFAAGDCAQTADGIGGLWTVARQQALVAGANLVLPPNERRAYKAIPPANVLKVAGIDLIAAGNLDPDGLLTSAGAETEKSYRKVVVDEQGLLVGYTNVGSSKGNRELGDALKRKVLSPEILKDLADPEFDFSRLAALPKV